MTSFLFHTEDTFLKWLKEKENTLQIDTNLVIFISDRNQKMYRDLMFYPVSILKHVS